MIQGNVPRAGLDFNAQRRAVLDNHVQQTLELAADVEDGRTPQPDLVIWPENSSDIDPFLNDDAAREIDRAAEAIGVPDPGRRGHRRARALHQQHRDRLGPGERARATPTSSGTRCRSASTSRTGRSSASSAPRSTASGGTSPAATRPGVLDVGGTRVGDLICFEVVYDGLVHDVVDGGAGMLVVQTNNATFGFTDESEQQLALSRLRAVEYGRTVVVAATSGISAVVAPDGSVVRSSQLFTPAVFVEDIAQRDSTTLALRLGSAPEWVLTALGLGALGAVVGPGLVARRRGAGGRGLAESMTDRVLVIVPTYNEVDNVERIVERLQASVPEAHVLVVDDGSPDGTGELAEKLAARDPRVHVLRRAGKAGLGPAYVAGFPGRWRTGTTSSSRWTPTARTPRSSCPGCWRRWRAPTWCWARATCPAAAWRTGRCTGCCSPALGNRYTRRLLRLPLSDATGGYRAARAELIDRLPFDDVASHGYCFQVDWAWRAVRAGARVTEVPITFTERTLGRSKMSGSIVREALVRVTVWGLQDRLADRLPDLVRRPVPGRPRDGGRSSAAR